MHTYTLVSLQISPSQYTVWNKINNQNKQQQKTSINAEGKEKKNNFHSHSQNLKLLLPNFTASMHELHSAAEDSCNLHCRPFIHPPMLHTFTTELKIWRKHSDAQVDATGSDHPPC